MYIKTYIVSHVYEQYLVLLTIPPRNIYSRQLRRLETPTYICSSTISSPTPTKLAVCAATVPRGQGGGTRDSDSLHCAGVVEHGTDVVHVASVEISQEHGGAVGMDLEHVTASTLSVLHRDGRGRGRHKHACMCTQYGVGKYSSVC